MLEDVDIKKMPVCRMFPAEKKIINILLVTKIMVPPKTSTYVESYDGETKWMDLSTEDDDLLEIYTSVWNEISNSIKNELDCQPMYH